MGSKLAQIGFVRIKKIIFYGLQYGGVRWRVMYEVEKIVTDCIWLLETEKKYHTVTMEIVHSFFFLSILIPTEFFMDCTWLLGTQRETKIFHVFLFLLHYFTRLLSLEYTVLAS